MTPPLIKSHSLSSMFAGVFRKQGFGVTEYLGIDLVEFGNGFIKGNVSFDKEGKCHTIRWKCKEGVYLYDIPVASIPGHISCDFKKAGDLLDFLQRRLVWKKQR